MGKRPLPPSHSRYSFRWCADELTYFPHQISVRSVFCVCWRLMHAFLLPISSLCCSPTCPVLRLVLSFCLKLTLLQPKRCISVHYGHNQSSSYSIAGQLDSLDTILLASTLIFLGTCFPGHLFSWAPVFLDITPPLVINYYKRSVSGQCLIWISSSCSAPSPYHSTETFFVTKQLIYSNHCL